MIQAREFYNITLNENNLYSNFTLLLFIWSGDKAEAPVAPLFSYDSGDLLNNETQKVNISNLIADYLEQQPPEINAGLKDFEAVKWFKYVVIYDGGASVFESEADIFTYGYNNNAKSILLDGSELSMYDKFIIPFVAGGIIEIKSFPNNEINQTLSIATSPESDKQIRYYVINRPLTDKYIKVTLLGESVTIYVEDSNFYGNKNIAFINSFGVPQLIPFYNKSTKSLDFTGDSYRGVGLLSKHKFADINKNGRKSLELKSNFHSEQTNDAFTSLCLSETIWVLEDDAYKPVNLDSKKLELKTKVNDKLISYDLSFKYSNNIINTYE